MKRAWMFRSVLFLCLVVSGIAGASRAQTTPAASGALPQPSPSPSPQALPQAPPSPSLEREFARNILRDQFAFVTSPFHLKTRDARFLLPFGVAAGALIATDHQTAALSNDQTRLTVSRDVSYIGAGYTAAGVAAAFYLAGRATHNARARETGILGAEALIDGAIDIQALKLISRRPRPTAKDGEGEFFDSGGGSSFPSGHAITAWSLATVIAEEYHDKPLVRFGAYGLAAAVSISRYTGRNHFLSDALVGSILGYGIGRYVYHAHHDPTIDAPGGTTAPARRKRFPMILPEYSGRERLYGVKMAWNF